MLLENHLIDAVAMDIKNSKERYALTCGLPADSFDITRIEESIRLLLTSGIPHEFRTTVVKELHDATQMQAIGVWLATLSASCNQGSICSSPYYLQEFKDAEHLICGQTTQYHAHNADTMNDFVSLLQSYLPNVKLRGQ